MPSLLSALACAAGPRAPASRPTGSRGSTTTSCATSACAEPTSMRCHTSKPRASKPRATDFGMSRSDCFGNVGPSRPAELIGDLP